MRNGLNGLFLVVVAALALSPVMLAQTAPKPGAARSAVVHGGEQGQTAKAIPDLSGIWEAPDELNPIYAKGKRNDLCGEGACEDALKFRPLDLIVTLEEPQMLPWVEEIYKTTRDVGGKDPNAPREGADPWFSACMPLSPTRLMLSPFVPIELRQFPDMVLLFFAGTAGGDHELRRIYVDGRDHPSNWKPTWMGHSIGKYEGDTLVVDTLGVKGERWIDDQGHPHSDALHLAERIRRVNQSLEYEVTITDPKAYKNSWRKKLVRELAPAGPRFWDAAECEELLRMGTHYSAESGQ